MQPMVLRTARLVLDQPTVDDIDTITEYCRDPLFDRYMTLPSPYERKDAEFWATRAVPANWASDSIFNWVIRTANNGALVGAIGHRVDLEDLGYWLGAPHRGHGYMTEAVMALLPWLAARGVAPVKWECREGNLASAAVARRSGFRFTGSAPSVVTFRDGSHPPAWHGEWLPGDTPTLDSWPKWTR